MNKDEIDLSKEWHLFKQSLDDSTSNQTTIREMSDKQLDFICSLHTSIDTDKSMVDFIYDLNPKFVQTLGPKDKFTLTKLT